MLGGAGVGTTQVTLVLRGLVESEGDGANFGCWLLIVSLSRRLVNIVLPSIRLAARFAPASAPGPVVVRVFLHLHL